MTYETSEILRSVLNANEGELYEETIEFFGNLHRTDSDVIVLMSRKAYSLYIAFEPVLRERGFGFGNKVTPDKMFWTWCDTYGNPNKIIVVDDTLLFGRTVSNFVNEIYKQLPDADISVSIFATADMPDRQGNIIDRENNIFKPKNSPNNKIAHWIKPPCYHGEESVRMFAQRFLEAISATLTPYTAHMASFTIDKKYLAELSVGAYAEREITNTAEESWGVKAKVLFPEKNEYNNLMFSGIRVFESEYFDKVEVRPYIALNEHYADIELPEIFSKISKTSVVEKHRLFIYACGLFIGKKFLEERGIPYDCISNLKILTEECNAKLLEVDIESILKSKWKDVDAKLSETDKKFTEVFLGRMEDYKKIYPGTLKTTNSKPIGLYEWLLIVFRETIIDSVDGISGSPHERIKGVSLLKLINWISSYKVESAVDKFDIYAAILALGNFGGAVTYINYDETKKVIGTFILDGEQAIQAIATLCPGFAFMLETIRNYQEETINHKVNSMIMERILQDEPCVEILTKNVINKTLSDKYFKLYCDKVYCTDYESEIPETSLSNFFMGIVHLYRGWVYGKNEFEEFVRKVANGEILMPEIAVSSAKRLERKN